MGRSFYPLTGATAVEDFQDHNTFEIPDQRVIYRMTSRDDGYWMQQNVLEADGGVLATLEKRIDYVVGSGRHSRSYLTRENDRLYQMPICWYPDKPGWDLCPGYDLENRFFTRKVDDDCLSCHNARMPQEPAGSGVYGDDVPYGIDCQRCHGPGEAHVAKWHNPPSQMPAVDDTIVNPRNLTRTGRMQVCMQCHMGDAETTERVTMKPGGVMGYRPGGHLQDYLDILSVTPPRENRFGLSSQADRLVLSRCFKESGGALDCLACHNPHSSVYAEDRPADLFRNACLTCHTVDSCEIQEPERRTRNEHDDCTACHMRKAEPADQRFTQFTDHWIRRSIDSPAPPAPADGKVLMARVLPGFAPANKARAALNQGKAYLFKKTNSVYGKNISWALPEAHLR